jgi:hypothetical protein
MGELSDKSTETLSWTDWRGNLISREVNLIADARNFERSAGYPWVIMAANPNLSCAEVERFLSAKKAEGVERSLSWIKRRKRMFRLNGDNRANRGRVADYDGNQARAVAIMKANPTLSARQMVYELKRHGIIRGRQWILDHRCDWVE